MSGIETIVRIMRTCCTLICHSFSEVSVHIYHVLYMHYHLHSCSWVSTWVFAWVLHCTQHLYLSPTLRRCSVRSRLILLSHHNNISAVICFDSALLLSPWWAQPSVFLLMGAWMVASVPVRGYVTVVQGGLEESVKCVCTYLTSQCRHITKRKWVFWHCGWISHPDFYVVASIWQMYRKLEKHDKLLTEIGTLSHSS